MNSDAEKIILEMTENNYKIDKRKTIAYDLYKELWKLVLIKKKYNYDNLLVKFKVICILENNYISENVGIEYKLIKNDKILITEKCNDQNIYTCIKENIDINLLIKLLKEDNFDIKVKDEISQIWISINFDKYNIDYHIDDILKNNKTIKRLNKR